MSDENIIIVGAGVAGLAAGRRLAESGKTVTIVEARNRIGGRIYTHRSGNQMFELGAEFVHGRPPDLWELIREANLRTEEMDGEQICYENGDLTKCGSGWEHDLELLEQLKTRTEIDCSFADYLDQHKVEGTRRQHLVSYIEGFNAADHRVIGVAALGKQQAAEDKIDGDKIFRVCGGYSQVPEFLAAKVLSAGGRIILNTQVQSIAWKRGEVELTCSVRDEIERINANRAVITLPLGVLQQGSVKFLPSPQHILQTAHSLRMGHVRRIDLLFQERFWATWQDRTPHLQLEELSFLFAFTEIPSTWWTQLPSRNAHLTGWVGGPRADTLADLNEHELGTKVCEVLARLFKANPEQLHSLLLECHSHDWQRDPLSFGAYSYVPTGAISAPDRMTEPVENTLYFAGEHTDTTGHWGTVHAALRSGVRAARQIVNN
jgi:monoamine oxidase